MGVSTDIDIDLPNRETALLNLECVQATITGRANKHPSGVYFQNIPVHPIDKMSAYDYIEASEHGFFKIDFLKNSIYEEIKDEAHLDRLLAIEPVWELFENQMILSQLAQVSDQHAILSKFKPKSIEELAICLALVRPGKRYLINKPYEQILQEIWKPTDQYYYKKSHSIAYAASIVVQLNLIVDQVCGD